MLSRDEKARVCCGIRQKNNQERKKKAHDSYLSAFLDDYQDNELTVFCMSK